MSDGGDGGLPVACKKSFKNFPEKHNNKLSHVRLKVSCQTESTDNQRLQ